MSSARLCTLLALGAAALGCHPLSPWHAPAYVTDDVPRLVARDARGPSAELEVLVDPLGVPHIFGASEADLAYGLGFLHGRDRRFQVEVVRHAAWGRLAELFGEALLPVDQELRLISLAVPAHAKALSKRDRALAEAYAAGLDDGHAHAGRTSEMKLIGLEPAP
jgi:penicillin amidase